MDNGLVSVFSFENGKGRVGREGKGQGTGVIGETKSLCHSVSSSRQQDRVVGLQFRRNRTG